MMLFFALPLFFHLIFGHASAQKTTEQPIKNPEPPTSEVLKKLEANPCAEPNPQSETEAGNGCKDCLKSQSQPAKMHAKSLVNKITQQKNYDQETKFYEYKFPNGASDSYSFVGITKREAEVMRDNAAANKVGPTELEGMKVLKEILKKNGAGEKLDSSEYQKVLQIANSLSKERSERRSAFLAKYQDNLDSTTKPFVNWGEHTFNVKLQNLKHLGEWASGDHNSGEPVIDSEYWEMEIYNSEAADAVVSKMDENMKLFAKVTEVREKMKVDEAKNLSAKELKRRKFERASFDVLFGSDPNKLLKEPNWPSECGLTPAENYAIKDYSGGGYSKLNEELRNGNVTVAGISEYQAVLNRALSKVKPFEGIVVRGTNLSPESRKLHQIGATVSYDAFTSTSLASGFSGTDIFFIKSKTGRFIAPLSLAPSEKEVLFSSGTKFKILEISGNETSGFKYVMEEVLK